MRVAMGGLVLLFVAPAPPGAQQPGAVATPHAVALPPALDRVLRDYERAWQARDPAALAALFTEDGFVLANGRPPVRGRTAIRDAYAEGGGPLALRPLAYAAEDSVGYIVGSYGPGPGSEHTGKFVLALRRGGDGRWLIAADIDNSNQRPSRAPSPAAPPGPPSCTLLSPHGAGNSFRNELSG